MSAPWNFARFLPLAERLLSRGRLPALLFAVARKGPRLGQLRDDVKLLQSLCLAWWRGEYRAISPKALVTIVAGLLYFVSPIDAIPDWLQLHNSLSRSLERLPATPEALRLERNTR